MKQRTEKRLKPFLEMRPSILPEYVAKLTPEQIGQINHICNVKKEEICCYIDNSVENINDENERLRKKAEQVKLINQIISVQAVLSAERERRKKNKKTNASAQTQSQSH